MEGSFFKCLSHHDILTLTSTHDIAVGSDEEMEIVLMKRKTKSLRPHKSSACLCGEVI